MAPQYSTPSSVSLGRMFFLAMKIRAKISSSIAMPASTIPVGTSGRGPVRGRMRVLISVAEVTIAPIIGRNARPVFTGLKPSVRCR